MLVSEPVNDPPYPVAAPMLLDAGSGVARGEAQLEGVAEGYPRCRARRSHGPLLQRAECAMPVLSYGRPSGHRLRLRRESGQADGPSHDRHVERHQHQVPCAGQRPPLRSAAHVRQLPPGTDHPAGVRGPAMSRWLLLLACSTAVAQTPDPQVDWVASWSNPTTLELSGHVEEGW